MLTNLLIPDIHEIIENKDWNSLKKSLADLPPADIAEILSDIDEKDAVILFRLLPRQLASDTRTAPFHPWLLISFLSRTFKSGLSPSPQDLRSLLRDFTQTKTWQSNGVSCFFMVASTGNTLNGCYFQNPSGS